jgi:hypothetical protein
MKNKRDLNKALKRCQRIIDALIDLKDDGFGCYAVERCLEGIHRVESALESQRNSL